MYTISIISHPPSFSVIKIKKSGPVKSLFYWECRSRVNDSRGSSNVENWEHDNSRPLSRHQPKLCRFTQGRIRTSIWFRLQIEFGTITRSSRDKRGLSMIGMVIINSPKKRYFILFDIVRYEMWMIVSLFQVLQVKSMSHLRRWIISGKRVAKWGALFNQTSVPMHYHRAWQHDTAVTLAGVFTAFLLQISNCKCRNVDII